MPKTINYNDLVTPAQAAERLGVTRQYIYLLMSPEMRRIKPVKIAGKHFVQWKDVAKFTPQAGGRPRIGVTRKKSRKGK
jgi:predicted DNA-binding transcriptional regulator AlpA